MGRAVALRTEADHHPLAAVLRGVDGASCPNRLNFHCHTICSDGSLQPHELAEQAMAIGLEHLAVTDHHASVAHASIERYFARVAATGRSVPTLWRGVEISCLLEGCLVHVLALGFGDDHASLLPYLQGSAVMGPALKAEAVLQAMTALAPGEVSQPVRSPFGWHLIQVLERRKEDLTRERERQVARQSIRVRKGDEAFTDWVRQLRDRAFVEYRLDDR
jgi:hypothetical protein